MIMYIDFSNYLKLYKFKLTLPLEAGKPLFIFCYFYGYNLELYCKLIQGHRSSRKTGHIKKNCT